MADGLEAFSLLHPAVQHHVVNSLGWGQLRPLQNLVIAPILAGEHVLATAPTAGGKTEAAILPLFSRMLTEDRRAVSVLYACPLRALHNSLHQRLERYATLLGRQAGLWHGDISSPGRARLLADQPDILLTTPESLEGMLVSTKVDHRRWFGNVRAVVIDEVHAFAGDDRGWHLLAVLERIRCLAGREVQRVALSATVGNAQDLLAWMTRTCQGAARVVSAPAGLDVPEITLDYVGSLHNAATVIARIHRGEKRLVFVDSRARAEHLAVALREREVTTFVSHASLAANERRQAEQAFADERDCVIVATSTLELGIDVGDLDRVVQIDSSPSVSSLLQRLGRTGRRPGAVRNALVLATRDDALLRAAAVLLRWGEGYVEPVEPPALPLHLFAQQLLALALQERGIGRHRWQEWLGHPFVLGAETAPFGPRIIDHLLEVGFLFDDGTSLLGIGVGAERALGRRHFMELLSVFTSSPVFSVRCGRDEIGSVPVETLMTSGRRDEPRVLVLGGKSWVVRHIDWTRRVVGVEPSPLPGVARWSGSARPLGAWVARGVREILLGHEPWGVAQSMRATERLGALRAENPWVQSASTCLVSTPERGTRWWTFAGWKANLALGDATRDLRTDVSSFDDLGIAVDPRVDLNQIGEAVQRLEPGTPSVDDRALEGLKFSDCLPKELALRVLANRVLDPDSVRIAVQERLTGWRQ